MRIPVFPFIVSALLCTSLLQAGDSHRSIKAVRTSNSPEIDGHLSEEVWRNASPASGFTQREPDEGKPATEQTEVRVLYDDEALYIGWMFYDSNPSGIVSRLSRRDDQVDSDMGSVRIDSYHDNQTAYEFTFNVAGVKVDIIQFDDGRREDISWDAVWDVETQILENGWSAEMRIPFSVLRYHSVENGSGETDWGINFIRHISRKRESSRWVFIPKKESGFISRFGHLTGLRDLPNPGQFELRPFVLSKQRFEPPKSNRDRIREFSFDAGINAKYSLSRNFTLDATVNPDFGQVEADPAVLNLSTYETFYPEKRPFFIEGTQIFRFQTFGGDGGGPGLFYSRRIGRAISAGEVSVPPGGKLEYVPQSTTILGAAKISGKTNGGLSVGILQAMTDEEYGRVIDVNGNRSEVLLEPYVHYSVIRLRQDILGNSNIGTILTTVTKKNQLPAVTNGWDWSFRLDNRYSIDGFVAHTHATNSARERMRGLAGRISFDQIAAENWLWSLGGRYTSKDYNPRDLGFMYRGDSYGTSGSIQFKEDVPTDVLRNYQIGLNGNMQWTLAGANIQTDMRLYGRFTLWNYWRLNANLSGDFGRFDDRETRGNGLYKKPESYRIGLGVSSDGQSDVSARLQQRFAWDSKAKKEWTTELGMTVRPLSWIDLNGDVEYQRTNRQEAWMVNITAGPDDPSSSIFGDRSTDQFNLTLRGTITFTRDLSLQYYSQLFLAKGIYKNPKFLIGVADFEPTWITTRHVFNNQSLNSNLVLRWEYLPGSTLFLVWSQARGGGDANYFTSFGDDVVESFRHFPSNVILLKVNYWLSI